MPKESEPLKKNNNTSSSEMMVITQNSHVEEVLISDEEQAESDAQPYESKLNEKLRALDLYEDGMTIQQKEELLAVVVASWETAEKEKTRRQFFQDYMNASEAFCNDQIEFSFQDSPDLSHETSLLSSATNCLDVTLSVGSSNVSCFSEDCETSSSKKSGNFSKQPAGYDSTAESSFEICENDNACSKSSFDLQPFTFSQSREVKPKGRPPRRGKSRRGRGAARQSLGVASVINTPTADVKKGKDTEELAEQQNKKHIVNKSISSWKPCSSPKETPLICSKRPWANEPEVRHTYTKEEYSKKILTLAKEFEFAQKECRIFQPTKWTFSKPYHLSRRGQFSKKSGKPDKFDIMIGGAKKKASDQSISEAELAAVSIIKNEPFSRTSGGAFRYVRTNKNKSNIARSNFEPQTTRSGVKYGFGSVPNQSAAETISRPPELDILKDSCQTLPSAKKDSRATKEPSSSQPTSSEVCNEVEVIVDEKLPRFNHLRPEISRESLPVNNDAIKRLKELPKCPTKSKMCTTRSKSHPVAANFEKQNHIGNSTCVDSDSSDCSSVIDVETIVDDEIEEFVLKRKMLHEHTSPEKESKISQSKRVKKNAS